MHDFVDRVVGTLDFRIEFLRPFYCVQISYEVVGYLVEVGERFRSPPNHPKGSSMMDDPMREGPYLHSIPLPRE